MSNTITVVDGKKFDSEDGGRLTDCCGCYSTFDQDGGLYCKACYRYVSFGEGDGSEALPGFRSAADRVEEWRRTGVFPKD